LERRRLERLGSIVRTGSFNFMYFLRHIIIFNNTYFHDYCGYLIFPKSSRECLLRMLKILYVFGYGQILVKHILFHIRLSLFFF
jgi:hypothetical protein